MAQRAAAWYTITIDTEVDGAWQPLEHSCTQVYDLGPEQLLGEIIKVYDLRDTTAAWRVLVYAGYNRCDELLVGHLEPARHPVA